MRLNGEIKADLPLKALSGEAPEYDRPWIETPAAAPPGDIPRIEPTKALMKLMACPNMASRAWVWSQYDHMVMADTVRNPGADAGVVRIHGTGKAIAFTSDVNPRYCLANPHRGGMQAVAEAYRNLTATGARALATTDNLNFGNPERPEIMGQLVGCIKGIGEAVAALDMPIVSGNVSLYNETEGRAILPTPTIGAVGLLNSLDEMIGTAPNDGDLLYLVGETAGHLGQSALLAEVFNREQGDAPPVDLDAERAAGGFVLAARDARLISAAHDLSDGGLAVSGAEMALAGDIGIALSKAPEMDAAPWFFGEDQARYLLACDPEKAGRLEALAQGAGVPLQKIGQAGGSDIALDGVAVPLDELRAAHEGALTKMLD